MPALKNRSCLIAPKSHNITKAKDNINLLRDETETLRSLTVSSQLCCNVSQLKTPEVGSYSFSGEYTLPPVFDTAHITVLS